MPRLRLLAAGLLASGLLLGVCAGSFFLKPSLGIGRPFYSSDGTLILANGSCILLRREFCERMGISTDAPQPIGNGLSFAWLRDDEWDFVRELLAIYKGPGTTRLSLWPALIPALLVCAHALRLRLRRPSTGCCTCGYDLHGIEGRCPECGAERTS